MGWHYTMLGRQQLSTEAEEQSCSLLGLTHPLSPSLSLSAPGSGGIRHKTGTSSSAFRPFDSEGLLCFSSFQKADLVFLCFHNCNCKSSYLQYSSFSSSPYISSPDACNYCLISPVLMDKKDYQSIYSK